MDILDHVLDVMSVPAAGDPTQAVRRVAVPAIVENRSCDVLVVGGGMSGVAAAIASSRLKMRTIVLEETDWIGGQLTAQGVSALDEHEHIEYFGGTATYYRIREEIRNRYRQKYSRVRDARELNPGRSWVTRLAFEPTVGLDVLQMLILDIPSNFRPIVELRTKAVAAELKGDRIYAILAVNFNTGTYTRYLPRQVIDATELGDLLPLCSIDHVIGAESQVSTGERHARADSCVKCVQSLTYPAALRMMSKTPKSSMEAPPGYGHYRDAQPYSLRIHVTGGEIYSEESGWLQYDAVDRLPGTKGGLWSYRRLVDHQFLGPPARVDISIVNWPGNDYRDQSLLTQHPAEQAHSLQQAKWISLGFVYWLQTEVGRNGGGNGYPEMSLAPDVYQTRDALSKHPYIRESRRIVPLRGIVEGDVSVETQPGACASPVVDSVGVGWYPIDIHAANPEDVAVSLKTRPFQIPLSALVPRRTPNLLAASKNIGTTHISNGCYRLHPIEWNIGEAAGTAAAIAAARSTSVQSLVTDSGLLHQVQSALVTSGVPLAWILDVPVDHPGFAAVQYAASSGSIDPREIELRASNLPITQQRHLGI